jgi:redox-sensitive bicupin YhaK (pirin superfamily)
VSGPVSTDDVPTAPGDGPAEPGAVEVTESREAAVGALTVRRALPRRGRRTVGAWCFVDHMGPATFAEGTSVDIGPHPHIGLQTVTWLLEGELLHRDGLGSEQLIRPGQLNLMTAGRGLAHAEEGTGPASRRMHGVQLWVALPAATRDGDPAFAHHAALPQVELGGGTATVLVGALGDVASPARRDTDHVGIALDLGGDPVTLPLDPAHEHALVVMSGALRLGAAVVAPGHLGYLGPGRDELRLAPVGPTRALLVGGVPFPEPILMWWNYVARTRDEVTAAHRAWTDRTDRFAPVPSSLPRIDTAPPPWG